jgi:hypothetical protein
MVQRRHRGFSSTRILIPLALTVAALGCGAGRGQAPGEVSAAATGACSQLRGGVWQASPEDIAQALKDLEPYWRRSPNDEAQLRAPVEHLLAVLLTVRMIVRDDTININSSEGAQVRPYRVVAEDGSTCRIAVGQGAPDALALAIRFVSPNATVVALEGAPRPPLIREFRVVRPSGS